MRGISNRQALPNFHSKVCASIRPHQIVLVSAHGEIAIAQFDQELLQIIAADTLQRDLFGIALALALALALVLCLCLHLHLHLHFALVLHEPMDHGNEGNWLLCCSFVKLTE